MRDTRDTSNKKKTARRVFSGFFDLVLTALSGLLIVLLLLMLTNIFNWLRDDVEITFSGLYNDINDALVLESAEDQQTTRE